MIEPDERAGPGGWHARLDLQIGLRDGQPRLELNRHSGPLRVQKLLQPGPGLPAELLLVHPPGGIAGGDRVELDLEVRAGARCLATTPGATRWYRSGGRPARQHSRLVVDNDSALEWLPQDSIVQDQADGEQHLEVELAADAAFLGWDVVQLGQADSGKPWQQGRWRQQFELRRGGRLLLAESADLSHADLADPALQLLAGYPVVGALWAIGGELALHAGAVLAACRTALADPQADPRSDPVQAGASWLGAGTDCLVVRALAHDAQALRQRLQAAWAVLRPVVIGSPAVAPRIWHT